MTHWPFVVHQSYSRRDDIHKVFGGQERSGIVTPKSAPGVFIFTGHGGGAVGYRDSFQANGSLRYTGQGQTGHMVMATGNAAIRDHAANGKDLLVFEQIKRGGLVRFLGLFACERWETERQLDVNGQDRDAIVFTLVPLCESDLEDNDLTTEPAPSLDLATLRAKAMAAAAPPKSKQNSKPTTVYDRSRDVRDYVLARAKGVCEGCENNAPFETTSGRPFLEAHHIRRLSDGGPDDPRFMAGVCPNCHRKAHYAADRVAFNLELKNKVASKEAALS
jgi:5-methylcytosine-specific restriction protein A